MNPGGGAAALPVESLKWLSTLFLMPLLPERYRNRWPWRHMLSQAFSQWFNTLLHAAASVVVWEIAYTAYQKEYGDMIAAAIWQGAEKDPDLMGTFLHWSGVIGFFSFPFTLKGFLVWMYLLDAVVRLASMAANSKHSASVFLVVPLWLFDKARGFWDQGRMIEVYGSAHEPDRLVVTDGGLSVRAARPHEDWHELLAFRYGGSLYRLDSFEDIEEGRRRCFEYRFSPWPDNATARRIVVLGGDEEAEGPEGAEGNDGIRD